MAPEVGRQAFALFILHGHVGRAVGLEVAQHAHDVIVLEARQRLRLLEEFLQTPLIDFGVGIVTAGARVDDGIPVALGIGLGEIFLERHQRVQVFVVGQVGNPETPLTQHRPDRVLAQLVADRQGIIFVLDAGRHGLGGRSRHAYLINSQRRLRPQPVEERKNAVKYET